MRHECRRTWACCIASRLRGRSWVQQLSEIGRIHERNSPDSSLGVRDTCVFEACGVVRTTCVRVARIGISAFIHRGMLIRIRDTVPFWNRRVNF